MFKAGMFGLWLAAIASVQGPGAAQGPGPVQSPASVQSSTAASAGVYTDAQAERGKTAFATYCTGCHTAASQSGEAFAKKWNAATAADLYRVLTDEMPKDDPGALNEKERADVIAYLFKINGFTSGATELPSDIEPLKKILITIK